MKILWIKSDFLHPTSKGGQIRTLETLKRLHRRHEIHYAGLHWPPDPESLRRAPEYCGRVYATPHRVASRPSLRFGAELALGVVSPLPLSILRYRSESMLRDLDALRRRERFDVTVCDFLNAAPNTPDLPGAVLFQHNVEAQLWRRQAATARHPARKAYFALQARKMFAYERAVTRAARLVLAVSEPDAATMRRDYGLHHVRAVPTGVDTGYFARRPSPKHADLVFAGSMDWRPNEDGAHWLIQNVMPLIWKRRPDTTLALAGRRPSATLRQLAADPRIHITGTVPDIRPYYWGASVSVVPLLAGGGTRLKIYEAMAAGVPVVSTSIGAEGLPVIHNQTLALADTPEAFAEDTLRLLHDPAHAARLSAAALDLVLRHHSWDQAALAFEHALLTP